MRDTTIDEYVKVNCCRYHTDVVREATDDFGAMRTALNDVCSIETELSGYAKELADASRTIWAIKAHRTRTNLGLRESKEAVDAYRNAKDPHWRCKLDLQHVERDLANYRDAYREMEQRVPEWEATQLIREIESLAPQVRYGWKNHIYSALRAYLYYEYQKEQSRKASVELTGAVDAWDQATKQLRTPDA